MFANSRNLVFIFFLALPTISSAEKQTAQASDGATNLLVEATCSAIEPGTWKASFSWTLGEQTKDTKLDITQYYNGWKTKQFKTIAQLKNAETSFDWSGGDPGGEYLWRLRTNVDDQWHVSETARYQVPVCPVDFIRPDENKPSGTKPDPIN
ncbi:MAG: hypothetical protein QNL62_02310 [Gammaproteobacteria bacterium]|nr:hypothetical protein [Gammaproteobacteria bacterium]